VTHRLEDSHWDDLVCCVALKTSSREGASFEDGWLHADLVRRVPETMKPRRIDIGAKNAAEDDGNVKTIDHVKAA
jgi:hypothetical protein